MPTTILRFADVQRSTGLSRSAIYRLLAAGDFPVPIQLGPRRVGFASDEIQRWIEERPRKQRCQPLN